MSKKVDHTAKSLHYPQRGFILTFLGQLWGDQMAESRVNTGSLPEKCQKGSATEYTFIS